jgi:lysophospholipase L1-like esterase
VLDYTSDYKIFKPNQEGKYVNINSDSFRGPEINWDEKKYKIFFLGGSTMYGGVTTSDDTTISGFVQKKMDENNMDVLIVNAGIEGYATVEEFYLVKNHILKFEPNMIVMYDGWNDASYLHTSKQYLNNNEYETDNLFVDETHSNIDIYKNKNPFSKIGSKLDLFFRDINYRTGIGSITFVYENFIKNTDWFDDMSFQEKTDLLEVRMMGNWNNVCKLGVDNGFQTVNILQPILGTGDRILHPEEMKILQEKEILENIKNVNLPKETEYCTNVFDFRSVLDDKNKTHIYYDGGHMSEFGYEIIAEKIYEKILPIVIEDLQK